MNPCVAPLLSAARCGDATRWAAVGAFHPLDGWAEDAANVGRANRGPRRSCGRRVWRCWQSAPNGTANHGRLADHADRAFSLSSDGVAMGGQCLSGCLRGLASCSAARRRTDLARAGWHRWSDWRCSAPRPAIIAAAGTTKRVQPVSTACLPCFIGIGRLGACYSV